MLFVRSLHTHTIICSMHSFRSTRLSYLFVHLTSAFVQIIQIGIVTHCHYCVPSSCIAQFLFSLGLFHSTSKFVTHTHLIWRILMMCTHLFICIFICNWANERVSDFPFIERISKFTLLIEYFFFTWNIFFFSKLFVNVIKTSKISLQ